MKKLTLLLVCLCCVNMAWAQNLSFLQCKSQQECIAAADLLLKESKRVFEVDDTTTLRKTKRFTIDYVSRGTDQPIELRVVFKIVEVGFSQALEIPGEDVFYFYGMTGKFLDVFPVWKRYFDPSAKIDEILQRGWECLSVDFGGQRRNLKLRESLNKESGVWIID